MTKKFVYFIAGILGAITLGVVAQNVYNQFSPGGALSGTWNVQNLELDQVSNINGTLGVESGGSGTDTLSGLLRGNGTAPIVTAVSSDVIALWAGACDANSVLVGDGSCQLKADGVTGVLVGDGTGFASAMSVDITDLWIGPCDDTTFLRGDGSCEEAGGGVEFGSFTLSPIATGFSVSPSPVDVEYTLIGNTVTLFIEFGSTGTSDGPQHNWTGVPMHLLPVSGGIGVQTNVAGMIDNGNDVLAVGVIPQNPFGPGNIGFRLLDPTLTTGFVRTNTAWTTSGTKGIPDNTTLTYYRPQ